VVLQSDSKDFGVCVLTAQTMADWHAPVQTIVAIAFLV